MTDPRLCPDCWATMSRGRCRACGWVEVREAPSGGRERCGVCFSREWTWRRDDNRGCNLCLADADRHLEWLAALERCPEWGKDPISTEALEQAKAAFSKYAEAVDALPWEATPPPSPPSSRRFGGPIDGIIAFLTWAHDTWVPLPGTPKWQVKRYRLAGDTCDTCGADLVGGHELGLRDRVDGLICWECFVPKPRQPDLSDALAAADRAKDQVASWPKWKRLAGGPFADAMARPVDVPDWSRIHQAQDRIREAEDLHRRVSEELDGGPVEVTWDEYEADPERVMRMAEDEVVTVVGEHPSQRMELSCPRGEGEDGCESE